MASTLLWASAVPSGSCLRALLCGVENSHSFSFACEQVQQFALAPASAVPLGERVLWASLQLLTAYEELFKRQVWDDWKKYGQ